MALVTKATGSKTCNMGLEKKFGQTVVVIRVITFKGRSTAKEPTCGLMGVSMMGIGTRIELKVLVLIRGSMDDSMLANGRIIICMAMALIFGKTVAGMKVSTSLIRSTGTESMNGLTDASMKEIGLLASSMAKENMF